MFILHILVILLITLINESIVTTAYDTLLIHNLIGLN